MKDEVLFDFARGTEPWPNIDDPVMGGLSRSTMCFEGAVAVFTGVVSLENSGGFASVRSAPAARDLSGFTGVALRIKGDGKIYGLRLRTAQSQADGITYQKKLETEADLWTEFRVSFDDFEPVFRGRRIPNYPKLDPGSLRTFGWIISDRQEGSFRLETAWIKAYRVDAPPARRP